MDLMLIPLF